MNGTLIEVGIALVLSGLGGAWLTRETAKWNGDNPDEAITHDGYAVLLFVGLMLLLVNLASWGIRSLASLL